MENLGVEKITMMDDCSNVWDLQNDVVICPVGGPLPASLNPQEFDAMSYPNDRPFMFRFGNHLGRLDVANYPGWWRSFTFCAAVAKNYGFEKIVFIESDAYVKSSRLCEYIKGLTDGWTVLWNPILQFPETSIQIICKEQIDVLFKYYEMGEDFWCKKRTTSEFAEHILPFTNICKEFKGDRYMEWGKDVPLDADYSCQEECV